MYFSTGWTCWDTKHENWSSSGRSLPQELVEVQKEGLEQTPEEEESPQLVSLTEIIFDSDD